MLTNEVVNFEQLAQSWLYKNSWQLLVKESLHKILVKATSLTTNSAFSVFAVCKQFHKTGEGSGACRITFE